MIQKEYHSDNILLIASGIPFSERELYKYEWYVDNVLISKNYQDVYSFSKNGLHTISLVVIDPNTNLRTRTNNILNVHLKQQAQV